MSETSSSPEMGKKFGPQDQGLKESRSTIEQLKGGGAADILDTKTRIDRRSFITRTGSLIGLGAAAAFLKHRQGTNEHTPPPPQSTPVVEAKEAPVELENDVKFLAKEGDQLEYSNVAQYYDANFIQLNGGIDGKPIIVRNEHKQHSNDVEELPASDMNDHGIGVIRVAGINQDNARPQDSFIDNDKNYVYEWLVLVRLTDDPEKPYVYVDGHGNVAEQPWFISPNFATLKEDSLQVINPHKPEALQ